MTPIIVHQQLGPMPVSPCPDTPEVEREIKAEWRRQADIALAVMMRNPVPRRSEK